MGSVVRLHYWASSKTFRLDAPTNEPPSYVVDVKIEAAPQERPVAWQWLDLPPSALASAMDLNWHSFAPEHSEAIEQASRATMGRVEIIIGLTKYVIQNFNGAYAEQRNERTGARRSVRRGYASDAAPPAVAAAERVGTGCPHGPHPSPAVPCRRPTIWPQTFAGAEPRSLTHRQQPRRDDASPRRSHETDP